MPGRFTLAVPATCPIGTDHGNSRLTSTTPDRLRNGEFRDFTRAMFLPGSVGVRGSSPLSSTLLTWDYD